MFGFHAWDLLIVLLIALVIFGPKKLPEIGGAVGKGIREFKKATSEVVEQVQSPLNTASKKEAETKQIPPTVVATEVTPTPEVVSSEKE